MIRITHIGQRFIHNGGAEIFLRDFSVHLSKLGCTITQSICTDANLYEQSFCESFPHPVIIGGEKEISQAILRNDVIVCWGNINLNSMNLPMPQISIFNACAEARIDN